MVQCVLSTCKALGLKTSSARQQPVGTCETTNIRKSFPRREVQESRHQRGQDQEARGQWLNAWKEGTILDLGGEQAEEGEW